MLSHSGIFWHRFFPQSNYI